MRYFLIYLKSLPMGIKKSTMCKSKLKTNCTSVTRYYIDNIDYCQYNISSSSEMMNVRTSYLNIDDS